MFQFKANGGFGQMFMKGKLDEAVTPQTRKLPRDWAEEGYFLAYKKFQHTYKVGELIDWYDGATGEKKTFTITLFNDKEIFLVDKNGKKQRFIVQWVGGPKGKSAGQ